MRSTNLLRAFAGNKCKISDITLSMSQVTDSDVFAVTGVSIIKKYVDGKPTDDVDGIRYLLTDTKTLTQISVKTLEKKPAITQDEIDNAGCLMYVKLPIEETLIKPYKMEFGKVSVSIIAPSVEVVSDIVVDYGVED